MEEKMVRISTYFSQRERDIIDQHRYDTSRSLFIRQAVRKAINENENNAPTGNQVTSPAPRSAAPEVSFATPTTTTTEKNTTEVEAV